MNAPTVQPLHDEPYKPHTMAPWAMAEFLILLDITMGRSTFTPAKVAAGVRQFRGWKGDKPHMRWKGLLFWHCQSCETQQCSTGLSWTNNLERCGTLRVLLHMATQGIQPELWLRAPLDPALGVRAPYKLTPVEAEQAKHKHDDFQQAGVIEEVPKAEWRRRRAAGAALASAFTVVQYKALRSSVADQARQDWLEQAPDEVERFVAKDKTVVPPTTAYKAKWRVVYDLKAINKATLKLPMAYGRQEAALAKALPGDTLAVLDVKDGFTAVPVGIATSCPFIFVTDGQAVMQAARMPFGYKLAPFFFCLFSGAVAQAAAASIGIAGGQVHMYMDDMMIALRAGSTIPPRALVDAVRALMTECGATVSVAKIEGPARRVTYLGLTIDTSGPSTEVWMPADKWFTLRELCRMIQALVARGEQPALAKGAFDSLIGKLGAVAAMLPLTKTALATMYRAQRRGGKRWELWRRTERICMRDAEVQALAQLQEQIESFPRRTLNQGPYRAARTVLFGAVDASGEGGLGGHLRVVGTMQATYWSTRVAGAEAGDEWVGLSTLLEVRAIVEAIHKATIMTRGRENGVRVELAVDSQAAVAIAKKGYSTKCETTNSLCARLEEDLAADAMELVVTWVPRGANWRADWLSHPGNERQPWMSDLPQSLAELATRDS